MFTMLGVKLATYLQKNGRSLCLCFVYHGTDFALRHRVFVTTFVQDVLQRRRMIIGPRELCDALQPRRLEYSIVDILSNIMA